MNPTSLDKRRMDHLTWPEFAQRVKENYIFILTVGAIEQHGPHLPIGFDYMSGNEISLKLAEQYPIVVMPPLTYGYRSQATIGGGDQFPGTTCIGAEALMFTVRDILEELLRHNVKRIVVNNSHLENQSFLVEGIELVRRKYNLVDLQVKILITGWGNFVKDDTLDACFENGDFPGWDPEHAAVIETSAMLALRPEIVDLSLLPDETANRYPKYSIFPTPSDIVTKNGALASAKGTTLAKGQRILKDVFDGFECAFDIEFGIKPNKFKVEGE